MSSQEFLNLTPMPSVPLNKGGYRGLCFFWAIPRYPFPRGQDFTTLPPPVPLRRGTGGGRGILYAIHRITRLSACGDAQAGIIKMKIPIRLN